MAEPIARIDELQPAPKRLLANAVKARLFRMGLGAQYTNLWWMRRARVRSPWLNWNTENKAVFIHVPKNAGSSLYKTLHIAQPSESHCTAFGDRSSNRVAWDHAFTFAFARNPWDRFVSAFHYLKHQPISADDKAWSAQMLGPFETFEQFASAMENRAFRSAVFMWRHFAPQWYFLCDLRGQIIVDHIARFEDLPREVESLGQRLGVDATVQRVNAVPRKHYSAYYDQRLQDVVASAYARDIALFGYSFETAPAG